MLDTPEWIYIASGFAAGLILTCAFFLRKFLVLERRNAQLTAEIEASRTMTTQMQGEFKLTAQEAVKNAHESFLQLARENFKQLQADGAHDLDKRQKAIDELVKPVQEHLKNLSGAIEQVKGTDKALREDLQNLGRETAKLVGALRDPSAQGLWGEYILEGLLEKSGLIRGVHYETQVSVESGSGRQRPDAVIHIQDGLNIVIDAKAPLNEFVQRLAEDLSESEQQNLMQNLARQVREHVKRLGAKNYWESMDSPDFTVLFLPSEHIFSMALRSDPALVDFAAQRDVIIASPTLLMSLIRVVGMSLRQMELAKNAQEISILGADLYKRFLTFTDHVGKIGKGLQSAMGSYDAAVGSLERSVLPAARKFHELQGTQGGTSELPEFKPIEQTPRILTLTHEDEKERKRA